MCRGTERHSEMWHGAICAEEVQEKSITSTDGWQEAMTDDGSTRGEVSVKLALCPVCAWYTMQRQDFNPAMAGYCSRYPPPWPVTVKLNIKPSDRYYFDSKDGNFKILSSPLEKHSTNNQHWTF